MFDKDAVYHLLFGENGVSIYVGKRASGKKDKKIKSMLGTTLKKLNGTSVDITCQTIASAIEQTIDVKRVGERKRLHCKETSNTTSRGRRVLIKR